MISADQTLVGNPRLIPMKGMEHAGMVLFHKVEQLEEGHFFMGASQSQVRRKWDSLGIASGVALELVVG